MAEKRIDILIRARDQASRVFGAVVSGVKSMAMALFSVQGLLAASIGGFGVVEGLKWAMDAWEGQEKASANLRTALLQAGEAGATSAPMIEQMAGELQKLTTIADESTVQLAASIATMTKLTGEDLKQATLAVQGLGRALGKEGDQAVAAYTKALNGNFAALEKLMPAIKACATDQERMAMVNKLAADGLGLLRSDASTAGGQLAQLKNAFGDVGEAIGEGMAPAIKRVTTWLLDLMPIFQNWGSQLGQLFDDAVTMATWFFNSVGVDSATLKVVLANPWLSLKMVALEVFTLISGYMDVFLNGVEIVGDTIGSFIGNVYNAFVVSFGNYMTMGNNLYNNFMGIFSNFWEAYMRLGRNLMTATKNIASNIAATFKAAFEAIKTGSLKPFENIAFKGLTDGFEDVSGKILDGIADLTKGTQQFQILGFEKLNMKSLMKESDRTTWLKGLLEESKKEWTKAGEQTLLKRPEKNTVISDFKGANSIRTDDKDPKVKKEKEVSRGGIEAIKISAQFLGLSDRFKSGEEVQNTIANNGKTANNKLDTLIQLFRRVKSEGHENEFKDGVYRVRPVPG